MDALFSVAGSARLAWSPHPLSTNPDPLHSHSTANGAINTTQEADPEARRALAEAFASEREAAKERILAVGARGAVAAAC